MESLHNYQVFEEAFRSGYALNWDDAEQIRCADAQEAAIAYAEEEHMYPNDIVLVRDMESGEVVRFTVSCAYSAQRVGGK